MKKLIVIIAAIVLACLAGCSDFINYDSADSSDNRTGEKIGDHNPNWEADYYEPRPTPTPTRRP